MPNTSARAKTTTQKGLGHDHQVHRGRLISRHVDGTCCWWCARKMYRDPLRNWDGKPLNADHERSRAKYGISGNQANRLLHDTCNKQRGDGSRDHDRPALSGVPPENLEPDPQLGPLMLAWP